MNSFQNKLLNIEKNLLLKVLQKSVDTLSPIINSTYRHNIKYSDEDYIKEIIDVLESSAIWNRYNETINGNTLRKKHSKWVKLGIYNHVYKNILNKYFNKTNISEECK